MDKNTIKNLISEIPYPIGSFFSLIPFNIKLGKAYSKSKNHILEFEKLPQNLKEAAIYSKTKSVVEHAINNNAFYRNFYRKKNFNISQLNGFEDIEKIPIVTKKDLQEYKLSERSNFRKGSMLINTGGTSGQPLAFYIDKNAYAREWAHMHKIWSHLDYNPSKLKLTIRGKNLGEQLVKYNPVHNEYLINSYSNLEDVCNELEKILDKRKIEYIHGYPSSIANFADYLVQNNNNILEKIKWNLKGIFLGSEYPAPIYREKIHRAFEVPSISWYGHSEMAILAYEKNNLFEYTPFQTYGYTEAVRTPSDKYRLVGTSFDNYDSPFIRYDTGDIITPLEYSSGILTAFKIGEGRTGEFLVDKNNHSISLTALIFGRHHKAFEKAIFVQVEQVDLGYATIFITPQKNMGSAINWEKEFEFSNVNIEFKFIEIEKPILTKAGKVSLLVKNKDGE